MQAATPIAQKTVNQLSTPQRSYTAEEYLALEETAEDKSDYWDGEIVPMTGGTTNHNEIAINVCVACKLALKQQGYRLFAGDVRLWIPRYRCYTYPDVMAIKGSPVYHRDRTDTITNPSIIVEVLSDSTRNYDRGDKFEAYRSISEFEEYILLDQYRYYAEQFVKTESGQWLLTAYDLPETVIQLASADCQLAFDEIYDQVEFESR